MGWQDYSRLISLIALIGAAPKITFGIWDEECEKHEIHTQR
jgi:hypothetical protein